jgi:hypothetical protein
MSLNLPPPALTRDGPTEKPVSVVPVLPSGVNPPPGGMPATPMPGALAGTPREQTEAFLRWFDRNGDSQLSRQEVVAGTMHNRLSAEAKTAGSDLLQLMNERKADSLSIAEARSNVESVFNRFSQGETTEDKAKSAERRLYAEVINNLGGRDGSLSRDDLTRMLREPGDWLQHVPNSGSMSSLQRQMWTDRLAEFAMFSLAEMQAAPSAMGQSLKLKDEFGMSQAIARLERTDWMSAGVQFALTDRPGAPPPAADIAPRAE